MFKVNRFNEVDFRRIFFYTHDRGFIIKSISSCEVAKLCANLKNMVKYLKKEKSQSLLSRIYGLYKVSLNGIKDIFLCIERNCVQVNPDNKLLQVFDLKGTGFGQEKLRVNIEEVKSERYNSVLTTDQIYRLKSIRVRSNPYRSLDFIALNNNYTDRFQVQIDRETR